MNPSLILPVHFVRCQLASSVMQVIPFLRCLHMEINLSIFPPNSDPAVNPIMTQLLLTDTIPFLYLFLKNELFLRYFDF